MKHEIQVETVFFQPSSIEESIQRISAYKTPNIVLWYIGPYGLRQHTIDFYRTNVFPQIFTHIENPKIWLVDLTAWGALKCKTCDINKKSSFAQLIDHFNHKSFKAIRCSDILSTIRERIFVQNCDKFIAISNRPKLQEKSRKYPEIGISVEDVFQHRSSPKSLRKKDASKTYSIFQYIEGLCICSEIAKEVSTHEINIAFLLPNDEYEYYHTECNSFARDVKQHLSQELKGLNQSRLKLRIVFSSFEYGAKRSDRPYLSFHSPKVKKSQFNQAHVFGKVS